MDVQPLVNEINGTRLKVTGPDEGQCTAVAHYWERKLGLPIVFGDAYQTFDNAPAEFYDKELNRPDNFPRPGAIVVWSANAGVHGLGPAGHTSVVTAADSEQFLSIDQNWPTGSSCKIVLHDYAGVKGWFYPKQTKATEGGNPGQVWVEESQVENWLHGPDGIDHWKGQYATVNDELTRLKALDAEKDTIIQTRDKAIEDLRAQLQTKEPVVVPVKPEYEVTYRENRYDATTTQEAFATDQTAAEPPLRVPAGTLIKVAGTFSNNGKDYVRTTFSVENNKWYGLPVEAFEPPTEHVPINITPIPPTSGNVLEIPPEDKIELPEPGPSLASKLVALIAALVGPILRKKGNKS
jgi:hypothetical protein